MTKLTVRELMDIRKKHRPNTPIWHRCSNIIELMQAPELPQAQYERQMADLQKLLAESNPEPPVSRASHYS